MWALAGTFLISLIFSLVLTRFLIPFFKRNKIVALDLQKKEKPLITNSGGIPVFFGLFMGLMFFIGVTLATAIYFKGIPYIWTLGGKTIQDESVYTEHYYQVNKTLKIIIEEYASSHRFDKYVVYELKDSVWIVTCADTFVSTHKSKISAINYLRFKYNNCRKNNSFFN